MKAPPASSDLGKGQRPEQSPPRSRFCLSHFPPRSTTSKPIGPKRARNHPAPLPDLLQDSIVGHGRRRKQAHDEHHDWIGIRRGLCNRCGKTFTFLPPFSPPYGHYSFDRPQPGAAALLPGRPFLGSRGAHRQRPRSRGRSLHAAPMVPKPGFFSAAVFALRPTILAVGARLSRTEMLVHDSLPLRWHTVFPFLARFWPLRI